MTGETSYVAGAVRILAPGPSATIQDLGRPGWFSAGVGVSGAADPDSLRHANRLVGNDDGAAGIECVLGGLTLEAIEAVILAVAGAPAPITVDGVPADHASVIWLAPGERLALGLAPAGLRVYVAIRGGVAVEPILGSRSRDTLAGLGPEPLRAGDLLPIGSAPPDRSADEAVPVGLTAAITNDPIVVRARLGPRADWFVRPEDLYAGSWSLTDRLDRIGARLARPGWDGGKNEQGRDGGKNEQGWDGGKVEQQGGPPLTRRDRRELPTEGMPLGAIQVPPSGEPVVFLADHPITGGYPVIGVVHSADLPRVAQARPGQQLIFVSEHWRTGIVRLADLQISVRGHPTATETAAIVAALTMLSDH